MPIPSSSNRGVLGRIGSMRAGDASASTTSSPALVTASTIAPLGWLGVFNTGRYLTFLSSGTFTAPISGYYRVRVLGAGGSGGIDLARTTGGGGGGFAMGLVWLNQGQTVSVTVGKGGVTTSYSGVAGGASSFGAHMSATGGAGGVSSDSVTPLGAVGGIGSGGSLINASGGRSGAIEGGSLVATGGGGAGSQLGNGGDSGSVLPGSGSSAATGGGAVGGVSSGNITPGTIAIATGGAGVGGISNAQFGGCDLQSAAAAATVNGVVNSSGAVLRFPGDGFAGGGGGPGLSASKAGGGGTGAGGDAHVIAQSSNVPGPGGFFGGSGGCVNAGNIANTSKPGFGGGGGGSASSTFNGKSEGGDGLVVVEW